MWEYARSVAYALGMDHFVYNFSDEFRSQVMDRFSESYLKGETPNPCIDCNRFIKFKLLYDRAGLLGFDDISTGHYARISFDSGSERWLLKKGLDRSKDQTMFLYAMNACPSSPVLYSP
jgi:tRNA-specific 2-thiouridylase